MKNILFAVWDATSKSSAGILQGTQFQMGDYDECMKADGPFRTQFCFVVITATVNSLDPPQDPHKLYHRPMENVLRRIYVSFVIFMSSMKNFT